MPLMEGKDIAVVRRFIQNGVNLHGRSGNGSALDWQRAVVRIPVKALDFSISYIYFYML
jgi:hypothetical protein